MKDPKGNEVQVDSLVEGFQGATRTVRVGRVYHVGPSWVAIWCEDPGKLGGHQAITYEGRFLVRGEPRPAAKRTDVPEALKR